MLGRVVDRARMEQSDAGLVAATEGWFVVNIRDAAWVTGEHFGDACVFEGDKAPFGQVGYTLMLLRPGQPSGLYHREADQEDFLVLSGECLLLVEGQERRLRAWDFVHCPAGTEHIFVGAGDGPSVVFMTGARWAPRDTTYVRSKVAIRHRAGVEQATSSSSEAYARFGRWRPGRPASWDGLPWDE
jgi:uncharacterized cupin superfamily protein